MKISYRLSIALLVILSVLGVSKLIVNAATTPSLGIAQTFAVLGSTFTNTSASTTINGDRGYTTGPATAPLGTGNTYIGGGVGNATYNQAVTDQNSALTLLNGEVCTFSFASGAIDLSLDTTHGTAGVYAPGVYCVNGAMSIGTGGITLNGSGTYIFRSTGALNTVASSIVTLVGASPCDIFWTPIGATTLGANSIFQGTVIDNAGITVGGASTWTGRALAAGGTVTTGAAASITAPNCVLPTSTPTATPTPTTTPLPTATAAPTSTVAPTSTPSVTMSPVPTLPETGRAAMTPVIGGSIGLVILAKITLINVYKRRRSIN